MIGFHSLGQEILAERLPQQGILYRDFKDVRA